MNPAGLFQLILLAAIWGASFLFMRIAVPAVGSSASVASRLVLGALFLIAIGQLRGVRLELGERWRAYLVLGIINTALPFMLFGLAARSLPAGLLSILNATATLWGAITGALWTRRLPGPLALLGLLLGIAGVAVLVGFDPEALRPGSGFGLACGLLAGLCYGTAATYTRFAAKVPPLANAQGSILMAALLVLPALAFDPPRTLQPGLQVTLALLALGLACSGLAYLIYFDLLKRYGAPQVLTVAFLIPLFGILWGWWFLNEPVGLNTLVGAPMVLLGTRLVTRS